MFNKINPFRAPTEVQVQNKEQLTEALKKAGKLNQWDVKTLSADSVLTQFKRSKKEIFRETVRSALIGARRVGKAGALAGAIGGGAFGIVGGLIAGIAFPPSLLAIGITVAVGAIKGTVVGGIVGMLMGGLFKGAKTALYLALTSPRMRLNRSARTGRNELERLEKEQMVKELKGEKLKRLNYLKEHVPLWEYAAHNLKSDDSSKAVEKLSAEIANQESVEVYSDTPATEDKKTTTASQSMSHDPSSPPIVENLILV